MICLPNKYTLNHEVKRGLFVFFITKKLIGMSVRKCKMANGLLWTHVGPKNKLCNDYITALDCGLTWSSSVFGIKTILTLAATLALTKEKRKSRWMSQTLAHIICEWLCVLYGNGFFLQKACNDDKSTFAISYMH